MKLQGKFIDAFYSPAGERLHGSGLQSNQIVESCGVFLAMCVSRLDASNLFWAVGEGKANLSNKTKAPVKTVRLQKEILRKKISAKDIHFVGQKPGPAPIPTPILEIGMEFSLKDFGNAREVVLREFGLFGGDATAQKDSGKMINYVIHPAVTISADFSLRRKLFLAFDPAFRPPSPAPGIGKAWPVIAVDGVGEKYAPLLKAQGVGTLAELLKIDLHAPVKNIPLVKLREFQKKASSVATLAVDATPFAALFQKSVSEILDLKPAQAAKAAGAGATLEQTEAFLDQLSVLQVALDDEFLRKLKLIDLIEKK